MACPKTSLNHMSRLRSQCHSQTKLMAALADGIRNHPVNPDCGENQPHRRKDPQHFGENTPGSRRARNRFSTIVTPKTAESGASPEIVRRTFSISAGGCMSRADDQSFVNPAFRPAGYGARGQLRIRDIRLRLRVHGQPKLFHVSHHANDLPRRSSGEESNLISWPIGSSLGQNCRAIASLITTTHADVSVSCSAMPRPRRIGMPIN